MMLSKKRALPQLAYISSVPNAWNILRETPENESFISKFDGSAALHEIINGPANGTISALHMAALNGHVETVQILLHLGASVFEVTVKDGTAIDLIETLSPGLQIGTCRNIKISLKSLVWE